MAYGRTAVPPGRLRRRGGAGRGGAAALDLALARALRAPCARRGGGGTTALALALALSWTYCAALRAAAQLVPGLLLAKRRWTEQCGRPSWPYP